MIRSSGGWEAIKKMRIDGLGKTADRPHLCLGHHLGGCQFPGSPVHIHHCKRRPSPYLCDGQPLQHTPGRGDRKFEVLVGLGPGHVYGGAFGHLRSGLFKPCNPVSALGPGSHAGSVFRQRGSLSGFEETFREPVGEERE